MSHWYANNSQLCCSVFGQLTLNTQKRTMRMIKKAYELYFGYKISDRIKTGFFIFIIQRVVWISCCAMRCTNGVDETARLYL